MGPDVELTSALPMPLTEDALDLALMRGEDLPAAALERARLSLLDWMVCGWAGRDEPIAKALRRLAARESGAATATIVGGDRVPARTAALVNGATSHALDFDDTHFAHVGHLSVGIYPAALAAAEEVDASALSLIGAFLVGAEAAIRIGVVLGQAHYDRGFHQTATAGAFGATIAAARLYGLTRDRTRAALGLCSTRASGLKSQFGTMGKPYNAGVAASNGVECAQLAALGLTSAEDGLMDPQGFVATHTDAANRAGLPSTRETFLFDGNKYKFHACCHGTHAMVEGLLEANVEGGDLSRVSAVALRTNPRWLTVCDKKSPRTGLEVKFSYAWLAGLALRGDETGDERLYTDALARDPELRDFAERVTVAGDPDVTDLRAEGEVTLANGRVVPFRHDLDAPLGNDVLLERLTAKAVSAIGEKGERFRERLDDLDGVAASDIALLLAGTGA